MVHLILIFSIKTQFNTSIDIKQLDGYNTIGECNSGAQKIVTILKQTDPDIRVDYFCENKGKV